MATTLEALQVALAHHQSGRLREAEVGYRQVLQAEPNNPQALHLLGLLAHQVGQHDVAASLIGQAVQLNPNCAEMHSNLGEVERTRGNLAPAEASLRRALALDARLPEAYNNLGTVLRAKSDWAGSRGAYEAAIRLRPNFAEAHNNLGTVLVELGDRDGALASYRQAVRFSPRYVSAYLNLGRTLQAGEQLAEAAEVYRLALTIEPLNATAHLNLGTVCQAVGQVEEARGEFEQALASDPRLADAHFNLAVLAHAAEDSARAVEHYRRTLALDPRHVRALLNLGKLLESQGELDEPLARYQQAVAADERSAAAWAAQAGVWRVLGKHAEAIAGYRRALELDPTFAEAENNLGVLYNDLGQYDEAVACFEHALAHEPNSAALLANLGTALGHQGRLDEGLAASRRAVELAPDKAGAFSNLLFGLNFAADTDPAEHFALHREWARRHAEPLTQVAPPTANDPSPERRLRVGYVSPYFRDHAVNFFTEPMIAAHDQQQFEVYCYSDVRFGDDATRRLQACVDQWRDVRLMSDEQLAAQVRADAIDILVDLTGHIAGHRLLAFARRPAPVQVTYIGYQNTTGMSAMDYRLTDAWADPPGETDQFYTERLVRLPRAYFCYRPSDDAPPTNELPAFERGSVTFGSFNNFSKVTEQARAAWMRILAGVPSSRLLVLANRGAYLRDHFDTLAHRHGIDPQRIELVDKRPRLDYLRLVQQADIALDPFPFNGHTTTCDAIWMGVPVVMLAGRNYAQRFGTEVLAQVGLDDWITRSPEAYVERALQAAADLKTLAQLRQSLRGRMAGSVLLDAEGFTRNLEQAYREMWRDWCARPSADRGPGTR